MPAPTAAWRAGFWPAPAARIWPMTTSLTCPGSTPARRSASAIATWPRKEAGTPLKAPLKAPTGVRAALAMTTSVMTVSCRLGSLARSALPPRPGPARGKVAAAILRCKATESTAARLDPIGEVAPQLVPGVDAGDHADMAGGRAQAFGARQ